MNKDQLIASGQALLDLDAKGVLVPHGIGGLAREIIEGFIALARRTQPSAGEVVAEPKRKHGYTVNLTEQEMDALEALAKEHDLPPWRVLLQGLRLYQSVAHPVDLGPMLDPSLVTRPDQSRVERLEMALLKWQHYDQVLRTIDGTMLLGGDMPTVDALYDECVALTDQALPALAAPSQQEGVTKELAELVIAARIVAFEDQSQEALDRLDKAAEAFADRVPWEDEPDEAALVDRDRVKP